MKIVRSLVALVAVLCLSVPPGLIASSHREAPITALDRAADITDVYAFRSYGPSATIPKVTLILVKNGVATEIFTWPQTAASHRIWRAAHCAVCSTRLQALCLCLSEFKFSME